MFLKKSYISSFIILLTSLFLSYSLTMAQYTSIPFTSAYPSYTTSYPTTNYTYATPTTTNAYSTYPTSTSYLSTNPYSTYPTSTSYLSTYPYSSYPTSTSYLSTNAYSTYPTSTSYLSTNPYSTYPTSSSYLSTNPYSTYPTSTSYLSTYPYSSYPTSSSYLSTNPFSAYPIASFGTYNPLSSIGFNSWGFGSFSPFSSPFNIQEQLINTTSSLLGLLTSLTAPPVPFLPSSSSIFSNPFFNSPYGGLSSSWPLTQQPYVPINPVGAVNPFDQYNPYAAVNPVNPFNPVDPFSTFNPVNPVDAFNPVSQQQNIAGNWTGTWFSQDNGVVNSGEVSISFTQSGAQITSQSVVSFVSLNGTPKLQANVTGTLNGATVNISGSMPSGSSVYTLTIIADISGNYMSGSYSVLDASGQTIESGTVSLSNGQ